MSTFSRTLRLTPVCPCLQVLKTFFGCLPGKDRRASACREQQTLTQDRATMLNASVSNIPVKPIETFVHLCAGPEVDA